MTARRRILSGAAVGVLAVAVVHLSILTLVGGAAALLIARIEGGIWVAVSALYYIVHLFPVVLLAPLILALFGVGIGGLTGYAGRHVPRALRIPFGAGIGALVHLAPMYVLAAFVVSADLLRGDVGASFTTLSGIAIVSIYPLVAGIVSGGICGFATLDWPAAGSVDRR